MTRVDVVVPTSGRASLEPLLAALEGFVQGRVIVVRDEVGRGPAWARNVGWRQSGAEWVQFLDDDVLVDEAWLGALERDLAGVAADVGASQGGVVVPLPAERQPTDWERNVAGLEDAVWATADMAFRRSALAAVGGFDERFPRAYREDADLGLRLVSAGWRIVPGARRVVHPVGAADRRVSVRKQAGNADDALMRRLHGRGWRERAGAGRGAFASHAATVGAAGLALAAGAAAAGQRRRRPLAATALASGAAWLGLTGRFAWRRIAPGPRTADEVATMLVTSAAIPFAAVWHRVRGELRAAYVGSAPLARACVGSAPLSGAHRPHASSIDGDPPHVPAAVLLDRDGTLVLDAPYNGDPDRVEPVPGARRALDRLRAADVPLAVVSNQSGVARGLLDFTQVAAVNARVEELLGPLGPWLVCPHGPDDGCACRKPLPGLVLAAANALGVAPERCAVIGDIGADVQAARAAGARAVLVPTAVTRPEEVAAAPEVAADLEAAVALLLGEEPAR